MYCEYCGCNLEPDANECPLCGAAVAAANGPEQTAQPQSVPPVAPVVEQTPQQQAPQTGGQQTPTPIYEQAAQAGQGQSQQSPPVPAAPTPIYQQAGGSAPYPQELPPAATGAERVHSIWEWLGYEIVTIIPLANLVLLCIWAFDAQPTALNRRNWARAKLVLLAVSALIGVLLVVALLAIAGALLNDPYYWYY